MPTMISDNLPGILDRIKALPHDWHGAGSLSLSVLRAMVSHTRGLDLRHSLETGSGKSTLLFSHLSPDHLVFSMDRGNNSIKQVRESPLFNPGSVTFVEGPTQQTLPAHAFQDPLDLILIDGPHGYPFPDLEYYYLYPHLAKGGLLILDDIDIPMVYHLFRFLMADEMYSLEQVVYKTAFFRRTQAPTFDPLGDGWWLQAYNKRKFRMEFSGLGYLRWLVPAMAREAWSRIFKA
jgi:predicted O-methyltransferase YrrM